MRLLLSSTVQSNGLTIDGGKTCFKTGDSITIRCGTPFKELYIVSKTDGVLTIPTFSNPFFSSSEAVTTHTFNLPQIYDDDTYFFTTEYFYNSSVDFYTLSISNYKTTYVSGETMTIQFNCDTFNELYLVNINGPVITVYSSTYTHSASFVLPELESGTYYITTEYFYYSSKTFTIVPPVTSFHLTPKMDDFYKNGIDNTGKFATHVICTNGCWLARGSVGTWCSSEALSYGLHFYSESYMIYNKSNQSTDTIITTIIQIINTILNLSNQVTTMSGTNADAYRHLIVPCWKFDPNSGETDINVYTDTYSLGNATDSDIELLTALLKLYLFDYKNPHFSTIQCSNLLEYTILGTPFRKTDTLQTVLKNMINLFAFNLLGNNAFSQTDIIFFSTECKNVNNQNSDSLKNGRFSDYINYICYIYLQKFFSISTPPNPVAIIDGTSYTMPSLDKTKTALNNYLDWINTTWSNPSLPMPYDLLGDGLGATYNRMSAHLGALYILLKKGDNRLGLSVTDCTNYWSNVCTKDITFITGLYQKLITSEYNATVDFITYPNSYRQDEYYNTAGLSLKLNTDAIPVPIAYVLTPEGNNQYALGYGADGFYRQLSYKIFETLNGTTLTPRSKTGFYFFENYTLDQYFGFNNDTTIPNTLQWVLDNYENGVYNNINYFTKAGTNGNNGWVNSCNPWKGNNDPYFMLSACTLHQINYILYKGI